VSRRSWKPSLADLHIPFGYAPLPQQKPLWDALHGGSKRAVAVWHRRFGKSLLAWNYIIEQAFLVPGLYWHAFPNYAQAKKTVWDGMDHTGRRFRDYVPAELIVGKREDEMSLHIQTAVPGKTSKIQLVGLDNPDSLRGANPQGIVFDEWALADELAWLIMRPVLNANDGWAVFIFTPNGHNHAFELYRDAQSWKDWYVERLTIDQTQMFPAGFASIEAFLDNERREGMPEELIAQEYRCSFEVALVGSYYGQHIVIAQTEGRIGRVPWIPTRPVVTGWDLGISDATSIWFAQMMPSGEVRFIDFEEGVGQDLAHYSKARSERPYTYYEDLVPHDAGQRMLTGKTCFELLRSMGCKPRMVPRLALQDGITAVRAMFPRFWFDEEKCEHGLQMLREYTKQYNRDTREYDDKPKHNYASHAADAIRTFAVGARETQRERQRLEWKVAVV
jgi:hypothetical protein